MFIFGEKIVLAVCGKKCIEHDIGRRREYFAKLIFAVVISFDEIKKIFSVRIISSENVRQPDQGICLLGMN